MTERSDTLEEVAALCDRLSDPSCEIGVESIGGFMDRDEFAVWFYRRRLKELARRFRGMADEPRQAEVLDAIKGYVRPRRRLVGPGGAEGEE